MVDTSADSPANSTDPIIVGRVLGAHGVFGEIRVRVLSAVSHRFDTGQFITISGDSHRIDSSTANGPELVTITLQGFSTVEAVNPFQGEWITVSPDLSDPLPEGEYYHYQLLGLMVITEEGEELGEIHEILETGSNDVYVVKGGGGEVLVPALATIIRQVNLSDGTMLVKLPEGLR